MFFAIRIVLGVLFVVSGLEKALSPSQNFLYVIEAYSILPVELARIVSVMFPWVELFTGIFLALGLWSRHALTAVMLISTSFIVIVGQAIIRQLPIDNCGCFGNLIHLPLRGVIVLDGTIFALTLWCLFNIGKVERMGLDSFYAKTGNAKKSKKQGRSV